MSCDDAGHQELSGRLHAALDKGCLSGVERALAAGACPTCHYPAEPPPIVAAAYRGQVGILKLLIHSEADIEDAFSIDNDGGTDVRHRLQGLRAIHAAITGLEVDALRVLLQAGADPNSTDSRGDTPLMVVSGKDIPADMQLEMMEALVRAGGDLLLAHEGHGGLPIHYAAERGSTLLMGWLVSSAPTTLNARTRCGYCPLARAARNGHWKTVSLLLAEGATDAWNAEGTSAMREAVKKGREKVVQVFLREGLEAVGGLGITPEAMSYAIKRCHIGILQLLLDVEGEEMRKTWARSQAYIGCMHTRTLQPIIHVAARYCSHRAADVLMRAGADECAVDDQGNLASDVIETLASVPSETSAGKAALKRMLKQAPAFRARSWAWPTQTGAASGIAAEVCQATPCSVQTPTVKVRLLQRKDCTYFCWALARYICECAAASRELLVNKSYPVI